MLKHFFDVPIEEDAFSAEMFYEQNFCLDTTFLIANASVLLFILLSMDICGVISLHLFLRNLASGM